MASASKIKATKHLVKEFDENCESIETESEIEDLRPVIERRKFSYTFHIPERRSGQHRVQSKKSSQNPVQIKLFSR